MQTRIRWILALALLLVSIGAPLYAQSRQSFEWVVARRLTVRNTANIEAGGLTVAGGVTTDDLTASDDLAVTDDLTVSGDATVTGGSTLNGDVFLDDDLTFEEQTVIEVSDDSTITPLGVYTPISSTAATGTSDIAAGDEGQLLILYNVGAQTITLTDTGDLLLSGNAALGADDNITLLFDGADWVELAQVDN